MAFAQTFATVSRDELTPAQLDHVLETDGPLEDAYFTTQFIETMDAQVWGQGFAPSVFCDESKVASQRTLKEKHLKLALEKNGQRYDAIWFGHADDLAGGQSRLPAGRKRIQRSDAGAVAGGACRVSLKPALAASVGNDRDEVLRSNQPGIIFNRE